MTPRFTESPLECGHIQVLQFVFKFFNQPSQRKESNKEKKDRDYLINYISIIWGGVGRVISSRNMDKKRRGRHFTDSSMEITSVVPADAIHRN